MKYGILNTDVLKAECFINARSELEAMQIFCKEQGADEKEIRKENGWYIITIDGVLYQCVPTEMVGVSF